MAQYRHIVLLCILSLVLLIHCACVQSVVTPQARQGVLDLSDWDFVRQGPVNLVGEWELYWRKLLTPEDFGRGFTDLNKHYINLPGLWKSSTIDGRALSPEGFATYRLTVRVKPDEIRKALLISRPLSVCKVWINGRLLSQTGRVGETRGSEAPREHMLLQSFLTTGKAINIVLQVSNYHNMQGGLIDAVRLGSEQHLRRSTHRKLILTAILGGALIVMAVFHLAQYVMRRSEAANLYFGLYCILQSVVMMSGDMGFCLMAILVPGLPWRMTIDLSLMPNAASVPLLVMFYHSLFPYQHARRVELFYLALGSAFLIYLALTPPNAYDSITLIFLLIGLTAFPYLFYRFIKDLTGGKAGIRILIPGYLFLVFSAINDKLFEQHLIHTARLLPFAMLFFILSYSFLISIRYSRVFSRLQELSFELEQKNIQLFRQDKLKDDFLANTSHELRTPLAGMIGLAEALTAGIGGKMSALAISNLGMIVSSGRRLSRLVNDVLDFSRLRHKDIKLTLRPVDPVLAIDTVLALSRELIRGKALELKQDIAPNISAVYADEDRLQQILFNLVGNAIKFTRNGAVTVSAAEKGGDRVAISVADTGIGIEQNALATIFESYEQLHREDGLAVGGTGLGLAVTRKLVQLHRGELRVESELGQGSVFTFTLPKSSGNPETTPDTVSKALPARADAAALDFPDLTEIHPSEPDHTPDRPSFTSESAGYVLIVDDEAVNRQVIAAHLSLEKIPVRLATDGKAALEILDRGPLPEIILLDIMMPGLNGYTVCRKLRETLTPSELPVIMLTARNRITDLVEGFRAGANDYLTKPFSRQELIARVKTQRNLKNAYETLHENLKLRQELALRRQTELDLRLTQRRLSEMLHAIEDALIAVNVSREISFCNRSFETLTGHSARTLLGNSLFSLFTEPDSEAVRTLTLVLDEEGFRSGETKQFMEVTISRTGGGGVAGDLLITPLELDEEPLYLFIFRPTPASATGIPVTAMDLIRELGRDRQRLATFEKVMYRLSRNRSQKGRVAADNLNTVDTLFEQLERNLSGDDGDSKRALAVQVLNLSLDYWITTTRNTKVALADRSRIWNIYIEKDGYARTQTLDKYLDINTLPQRPRWKQVCATADFVLSDLSEPSHLREQLEKALSRLKNIL